MEKTGKTIPHTSPSTLAPNTLVLGMVWLRENALTFKEAKHLKLTTPPPLRDYYRLVELESLHSMSQSWPKFETMTYSCGTHPDAANSERHHEGYVGERGARNFAKVLKSGGRHATFCPFSYILGDYFRFPTAYARNMYGSSGAKFLKTLLLANVISPDTQIVWPNLPGLKAEIEREFGTQLQIGEWEEISCKESPLWVATENLQRKVSEGSAPDVFAGYDNTRELWSAGVIEREKPFVQFRISLVASRKRRRTLKVNGQRRGKGQGQKGKGKTIESSQDKKLRTKK